MNFLCLSQDCQRKLTSAADTQLIHLKKISFLVIRALFQLAILSNYLQFLSIYMTRLYFNSLNIIRYQLICVNKRIKRTNNYQMKFATAQYLMKLKLFCEEELLVLILQTLAQLFYQLQHGKLVIRIIITTNNNYYPMFKNILLLLMTQMFIQKQSILIYKN